MREIKIKFDARYFVKSLNPDEAFAIYRALIGNPAVLERVDKTGLFVMPSKRRKQPKGDALTMREFMELEL